MGNCIFIIFDEMNMSYSIQLSTYFEVSVVFSQIIRGLRSQIQSITHFSFAEENIPLCIPIHLHFRLTLLLPNTHYRYRFHTHHTPLPHLPIDTHARMHPMIPIQVFKKDYQYQLNSELEVGVGYVEDSKSNIRPNEFTNLKQ